MYRACRMATKAYDGPDVVRSRASFGRTLALLRGTIEELNTATVAAQRYEALRCLGPNRAAVCRRIYAGFYAIANASIVRAPNRNQELLHAPLPPA